MPNLLDVSPDEAMQLGRCPECGRQLMRSAARAHAEDHWGGGRARSPEAQRRYDMLVNFADDNVEPPTAPSRDTWVHTVIAGCAITQGLALLFSNQRPLGLPAWYYGTVLTAFGLGWLLVHRSGTFGMRRADRAPNSWALAIVIVAAMVTIYDVLDRHWSSLPPPTPAWFNNDSLKWKMAKDLREQIQARIHAPNADTCTAIVIHYPTPYSQHVASELNTLLGFAGCRIDDVLADRTLDNGLEIRTARTGASPAYAEFMRDVLNKQAGVDVPYNFTDQSGKGTPEMTKLP